MKNFFYSERMRKALTERDPDAIALLRTALHCAEKVRDENDVAFDMQLAVYTQGNTKEDRLCVARRIVDKFTKR